MKKHRKAKELAPAQMAVVRRGRKAGLTEDQISVYADPTFSPEQMEQIRLGLLDRLSPKEIRVFADPLVTPEEMARIRKIYRLSAEIDRGMGKLTHMIEEAEQRSKSSSQSQLLSRKPGR